MTGLRDQHGALAWGLGLGPDLLDIGQRHRGGCHRDRARGDLGDQRRELGEVGPRRDGALATALEPEVGRRPTASTSTMNSSAAFGCGTSNGW